MIQNLLTECSEFAVNDRASELQWKSNHRSLRRMNHRQDTLRLHPNFKNNSVLYIGVTSQLAQRIWQHKNGVIDGFTKKYHVHKLVYFELFEDMATAINREKLLKQWKREWKLDLVRKTNPDFLDLSNEF